MYSIDVAWSLARVKRVRRFSETVVLPDEVRTSTPLSCICGDEVYLPCTDVDAEETSTYRSQRMTHTQFFAVLSVGWHLVSSEGIALRSGERCLVLRSHEGQLVNTNS